MQGLQGLCRTDGGLPQRLQLAIAQAAVQPIGSQQVAVAGLRLAVPDVQPILGRQAFFAVLIVFIVLIGNAQI